MGASSNLRSNLTSEIKSRAGWGVFLGIVMAALGVLLIVYPLFAATVTTIFIGSILLIAGVVAIVLALRAHKAGTFFLRLLLGVVYGLGGLLLLFNPHWGVAVLTVVLGVMLLFEAGAATALGLEVRSGPSEPWLVLQFWYWGLAVLPFPRACAKRRKDLKTEIFDRDEQHSLWLGHFFGLTV